MIEVKKTSIQIPIDTLIKIKSLAVKKGTTQNNIIIELIKKGLEIKEGEKSQNKSNETAIKRVERLTNGKAKIINKNTYNTSKSNSIKGIIEAPKGFNVVKDVHYANTGKWKK